MFSFYSISPQIYKTRLFKRPRMLIMGCGNIGKRIIKSSPKFWCFICTNTSNINTVNICNTKNNVKNFICNLDNIYIDNKNKNTLKRLKALSCVTPFIIYLIPPQNNGYIDKRIKYMQHILSKKIKYKNKRCVYVSTTGVYGNHDGAYVNECTLTNPKSLRACRRVYAEQYMRKLCRKIHTTHSTYLSIARVPGIYAADRLPLTRLQQNVPILNIHDDIYTNHIHADDLAHILKRMLFNKKAKGGRVFNIVDDSDIKAGDWLEYIARKYNLPMPQRMNKKDLMQHIDERRRSFLSESRRITNQRLKKELKINLKYPKVFDGV